MILTVNEPTCQHTVTMASPIHAFYRVFFTTIDPIIALMGVLTPLLAPEAYLQSFSPSPALPPTIETTLSLDILASCFGGTMILQLWLLRARPRDLVVWRAVEAFILVTDIGILGGYARALSVQGRVLPMYWRQEEWSQIGIVSMVGLIRMCFLLGLCVRA